MDKAEDKRALHETYGAHICEMEAAGIVLTCDRAGVPCLLLKIVSDGITGGAEEFQATKAEAAEKVTALKAQGVNPCLAVILVGENPASQVYVRGKINDCTQCGIESRSINLPADTTQETLLAEVKKLADDPAVHGILVQ